VVIRGAVAALMLLGLLAGACVVPARAQETRIAAVVNDEAISVSDLTTRIRLVIATSNLEDTSQNAQRIARQVLRTLIDEKLEMQEAKRLNITVSDAEINEHLAQVEAQNRMPKGGLEQFLAAHGLARSALVDQVTPFLAWGKVVRQSLSQLAAVSDDEIEAEMARLREISGEPKVRLAEILLALDNPQQEDEVHRFADRLVDQLRGGAAFSALARQFSQSATAAVGGDIGWVTPSQLSNEIGQAAQHLNPGEFSAPIRAPGGYYLLLVIEKQSSGSSAADDTHVRLTQVMFPLAPGAPEAERQRVTAIAENVAKNARSCGELAQIGRQQAPQTSGDLGRVRVGDLPQELRGAVLALKVAEPSRPMTLRGGIGVLMVCDREEAPSALPSREQVANKLSNDRFETLARRYLRDLRRAAFVDQRG
jgi:peptidyl-prolyl cis-trans isomerase SurA